MNYNPFSLEGKTILVTGASSGIGRGVAIACSKMGAKVVITGRNPDRLKETFCNLIGDGHKSVIADLSDYTGIQKLIDNCGDLNGCVHCAGISKILGIKHINSETLNKIVNINQNAPILLTSGLVKNKKIQQGSSIVFIASMAGTFVTNVGESAYSATKGAISGFAKGAALELASQKTRVNTICPAMVSTDLLDGGYKSLFSESHWEEYYKKYPLKRIGTTEDIANGCIYLLSDASSWVTGINLLMDGGFCLI